VTDTVATTVFYYKAMEGYKAFLVLMHFNTSRCLNFEINYLFSCV